LGHLLPLARAALTVEVTRPQERPASRCCVGAFQNSQRLEMCGAPRSGQRGWSTCTPSRVHIRIVGDPYLGIISGSPVIRPHAPNRRTINEPACLEFVSSAALIGAATQMARRGPRPAARSFQDQCARRERSFGPRTWWCNAIRRLSPNSR
jgi:hypothetical protein